MEKITIIHSFFKYKRILFLIKSVISISVLIYLFNVVDWNRLKTLGSDTVYGLLISLVISFIALVILSFRWSILLNIQNTYRTSLVKAYKGYLIGMFFNIFLPGSIGGDVVRVKYGAESANISIRKSTLVVFSERLFGFMALLVIFSIGVFFNIGLLDKIDVKIDQLFMLLFFFLLLLALAKYIILKYIKVSLSNFLLILFLSLLPHLGNVATVAILAWSVGSSIDVVKLLFIVPLVQIASMLPISLGGLGVREGVLAGLLTLFNIGVNDGAIISLMMFLVLFITGLFGLPFLLKKI